MRLARRRKAMIAVTGVLALLLAACGSSSAADVTVTSFVTAAPESSPASSAATTSPESTSASAAPSPTATQSGDGTVAEGVAMPSGFVPTKLRPGEKPPQFIIVSFDGVGWHEKWQHWFDVGKQVPFHFTGFLSGTYMLSDETRNAYQGPDHPPGKSDIGWNLATDLTTEIQDLNTAYAEGNEIGTHFNGHFCDGGSEPSGGVWSRDQWNWELDQFYSLIDNVKANNPGVPMADLAFDPKQEVRGERTPCLEGKAEELFPALVDHGITYDSSFTKHGISWPKQSQQYKIWQFGMAEFPIHGTDKFLITMDYNFYFTQRKGSSKGVTPAESAADSEQVYQTYNDMFNATWNGNRAPLVLGNHFNAWNNSAYENALTKFVLEKCGQEGVECVPFRDVLAWMSVQDPDRLAQLQAQAPEVGG
ncbi:MAG TPA: hypothetical protein VIU11_11305 [Nakamurella sp.]